MMLSSNTATFMYFQPGTLSSEYLHFTALHTREGVSQLRQERMCNRFKA